MLYNLENTVEIGIFADVWLNGLPVSDVIEADTDEGYIVRYKRNADGEFCIVGDDILTERLCGDVRVETRREP